MKLLLCRRCQDIVSLRAEVRTCACGATGGRYLDDLNAEIWGAEAIPLGFNNSSLSLALALQRQHGDRPDGRGRSFAAFVIPAAAATVRRVSPPAKPET